MVYCGLPTADTAQWPNAGLLLCNVCLFYYSDRYNMYKYTISINDEDSISSLLWLTSHFCLLEKEKEK